ncbi:MAG TPA: ATP-binding protein [Kouleothrix sp.]|uniref:sensor histidine kinase n=1 Tax=Kouleothrix sp. TaxID=2779161 RepID=UPI002CE16033|nr:ATP-binding protein [Kouleothrix sp.]
MESELRDVYEQLVATLRELLPCSGIAVLLPSGAAIITAAQFGIPALPSQIPANPSTLGALQRIMAARQPVLARAAGARLPTPGAGPDWLAAPILAGDECYGCVSLSGEFAPGHERLALSAARQAGLALRIAQRAGAPLNHDPQLRSLEARVRQAADQATALALVVDAALALTQASHCGIFTNKQGRAALLARRGYTPEEAALVQQIPPSLEHGLTGRAFRDGTLAYSADIENDALALPALAGSRAQLVIPIGEGQPCLGIIDLQSSRLGAFQPLDPALFLALGHLAAVALAAPAARTLGAPASETHVSAEHDLLLSSRLAVVTDLAAGVAHEINNPLTTILGYTHLLLRDQQLPQATRDDIAQIMVEGQRIAALVERFLRFAQPSATGKCPVVIDEPLHEALGLLRSRIQESGIHLDVALPESSPMVLGQAGQIEQAFLELLQNAIEAMNTSDERRLSVQVSEQHNWVRVAIADTGRGIRPDLLTRVFEPGFTTKVDKGIARGLGLGLYAVHTIAQEHWGRVEVQSHVWRGSTFTLCLPAI